MKAIYLELRNDFIVKKHVSLFKKQDWELIEKFIFENEKTTTSERQLKINRLFIDMPAKPKNWLYIVEFLSFFNSRLERSGRTCTAFS